MSREVTRRNMRNLAWFKSSHSAGDGGNCVEVGATAERVYVRDSKDKAGPILSFDATTWAEFVQYAATHD